jgi:transcriptional regulator with XRE-family HTH domain
MELGERIRGLREKMGLTQKELASKLKIPNQNISNYERGFRQPDYETLQKIADFFEVSIDYLLGRSDKPIYDDDEEFEKFINDPELERWYKELPKSKEEDLRKLRKMWEIIKSEEN